MSQDAEYYREYRRKRREARKLAKSGVSEATLEERSPGKAYDEAPQPVEEKLTKGEMANKIRFLEDEVARLKRALAQANRDRVLNAVNTKK